MDIFRYKSILLMIKQKYTNIAKTYTMMLLIGM